MRRYKIYLWLVFFVMITSSCGSSRKLAERQQKVDRLVSTARSYTGTPYKWGGVNSSGMDCSGLLYCSFNAIGQELPRTSEAQLEIGKKVKINKLQPGDLVFFAMGKKKRKVTHVGLVTDVRGPDKVYFIHSSSSRGVIETNIFQEYYLKRFRKARRVL